MTPPRLEVVGVGVDGGDLAGYVASGTASSSASASHPGLDEQHVGLVHLGGQRQRRRVGDRAAASGRCGPAAPRRAVPVTDAPPSRAAAEQLAGLALQRPRAAGRAGSGARGSHRCSARRPSGTRCRRSARGRPGPRRCAGRPGPPPGSAPAGRSDSDDTASARLPSPAWNWRTASWACARAAAYCASDAADGGQRLAAYLPVGDAPRRRARARVNASRAVRVGLRLLRRTGPRRRHARPGPRRRPRRRPPGLPQRSPGRRRVDAQQHPAGADPLPVADSQQLDPPVRRRGELGGGLGADHGGCLDDLGDGGPAHRGDPDPGVVVTAAGGQAARTTSSRASTAREHPAS